jgi:phage terminase Nu1 subunit (DNA packaging protein)
MASYILMALTNPAEGREDDYNKWLDDTHLPEVLKVEGFESVQRYELTEAQRVPPPLPYKYATVYDIETTDLAHTLSKLGAAVAAGTKTDSGDPSRRALWVFSPRGSRRRSS